MIERIDKFLKDTTKGWIIVFIIFTSMVSIIPPWIHYDIIADDGAFWYIPLAKMYLSGDFAKTLELELPVYPALLAGMSFLTELNLELSGRILSAVFYVLSAVGIYRLTLMVFRSKLTALIAVVFLITNRDLMDLGVDCLKDTLVLCLVLWATYFIARWMYETKNPVFLIISLILYVLGTMVRSTPVFFVIGLIILWFFSLKKTSMKISIFTACCLWLTGLFFFKSFFNQYGSLRSFNINILAIDQNFFTQLLKYLECYFTGGNPVAVVLGGFGAVYYFKKNSYAKLVVYVFVISMAVLSLSDYISDRFMMPMIMMLYPISANLVTKCMSSQKYILKAVGIIAVLYSLAQWGDLALKKSEPRRLAIRKAGEWIYHNYGSDITISSNQSRVIFYAGIETPIETRKNLDKIDLDHPSEIIAVDVSKDDGKEIREVVEAKGGALVKEIPPIFIFSFR